MNRAFLRRWFQALKKSQYQSFEEWVQRRTYEEPDAQDWAGKKEAHGAEEPKESRQHRPRLGNLWAGYRRLQTRKTMEASFESEKEEEEDELAGYNGWLPGRFFEKY